MSSRADVVEVPGLAPAGLDADAAYAALAARDRRFDGRIWFGVTSTGVYCRPVCPAQTPKAQNVRFFAAPAAAVSAGFRLLAGYIFGGNVRKQSIAMTTPVVQAKAGGESIAMTAPVTQIAAGSGWVIRFMMPAGYTLDTLPTPNDPKVHLVTLPPTRFAVVRFSGLAGEDSITEKTAELTAFIASHQLRAIGTASLARYDPPWTPWFMRRNEVMVPLAVATAR